jgi:quercetin dioxygenase-like cupin family protein
MPTMSGQLCVLPADPALERAPERPGAGPDCGFPALEQSVLWLEAGRPASRETGEAEEVLFVLEGSGVLRVDGEEHALEPESGANLAPGQRYELDPGPTGLRVVHVRIPDPSRDSDGAGRESPRAVVRRLEDQAEQDATTNRRFRIVADPGTGLRSATHFVGYIPTVRAPEHFHTYDEVIYVLEGEGRFHADGDAHPLAAGTCIGLPARKIHCLENTGPGGMRLVAVFRPAGSPAAAYYPDGTPAFEGIESIP